MSLVAEMQIFFKIIAYFLLYLRKKLYICTIINTKYYKNEK